MKRVVLLTGHYAASKRRAGFHWLADAFARAGWDTGFVTVSLSWLSVLRGGFRTEYPIRAEANRIVPEGPGRWRYVWFTRWHPVALRPAWLDRCATPWWRRYGRLPLGALEAELRRADLVVFESTAGLLLADRIAALAPRGRCVYRVSDDLDLLRAPHAVREAERAALPRFARVSVPSRRLLERFAGVATAALDPHGVPAEALDRPTASPYPDDAATDAVFVGVNWLDRDALLRAATALPDWRFHVIGPHRGLPALPNLRALGELAFEDTVPYLQHADVGLAMLGGAPGMEVFTDSLKILQYTWCRLPIVAPEAMASGRPHVHTYRPGDTASIRAACLAARAHDRATITRAGIQTWDALAATLAGAGEL